MEEARTKMNFKYGMFILDGKRIQSYDELVRIASQEKYKDKEYIEVKAVIHMAGG